SRSRIGRGQPTGLMNLPTATPQRERTPGSISGPQKRGLLDLTLRIRERPKPSMPAISRTKELGSGTGLGSGTAEFPIPSLRRKEYSGPTPGPNENLGSMNALANADVPEDPAAAKASATMVTL